MKTLSLTQEQARSYAYELAFAFVGSIFICLGARIVVPLYPVDMTLQTFTLFVLALIVGPKRTLHAAFLYLAEISFGLPVLRSGKIDPHWFCDLTAGYLWAFPFAGYAIGRVYLMREKSVMWALASILVGQMIIYTAGPLWLSQTFGMREAIMGGVVPFIPLAIVKALAAATTTRWIENFRSQS